MRKWDEIAGLQLDRVEINHMYPCVPCALSIYDSNFGRTIGCLETPSSSTLGTGSGGAVFHVQQAPVN